MSPSTLIDICGSYQSDCLRTDLFSFGFLSLLVSNDGDWSDVSSQSFLHPAPLRSLDWIQQTSDRPILILNIGIRLWKRSNKAQESSFPGSESMMGERLLMCGQIVSQVFHFEE